MNTGADDAGVETWAERSESVRYVDNPDSEPEVGEEGRVDCRDIIVGGKKLRARLCAYM